MSWHYSQALVEAFSAGNCLDGEQCARLKSTRTAEKSCFDDKKKGSYRRSLSGMTYEPSTASLGVERWMSLLLASRASRSVLPESEQEPTTNATSGPKRSEYFAKFDHDTHSWKMFLALFPADTSQPFSDNWPRAGSMRNGVCSARTMSVPRTDGSGCGYWPTPTVGDFKSARNSTANRLRIPPTGIHKGDTLTDAVTMWPTPRATDGSHGGRVTPRKSREGGNLIEAVSSRAIWPTPTVADANGNSSQEKITQRHAKMPGHVPSILRERVGGQLNPTWVEWLMGWPLGWTDLEPLETGKFRQWLEQHGSC